MDWVSECSPLYRRGARLAVFFMFLRSLLFGRAFLCSGIFICCGFSVFLLGFMLFLPRGLCIYASRQ